MDDDVETTHETPMFLCFNLKIHVYLCLLVNETKNRSRVWNRFITHESQVSIYRNQDVVDSYNLKYLHERYEN